MPAHVQDGACYRHELSVFGARDTVTVTVTEHRAPAVFAILAEGNYGVDLELAFRVEPADGPGSVVRLEAQAAGKLAPPLALLARRGLDGPMEQSLKKLEQDVIERPTLTRA